VITSAVRVGGERGFYLEDAGFPEYVTWMLQMFGLPRPLWRLVKRRFVWDWVGEGPDPHLTEELSRLFSNTALSAGVLPLLAMGRDVPDGRMRLYRGRLHVDWTKRRSGPYFDRVRETSKRIAHELGARFVDDPISYIGRLITVHPLGGCPMGRHEKEGVVCPYGEVFGYPGLYVADGSVMPGPVGANPSLTIAAVADRFAERLLETKGKGNG
jgi:cholesterol oxidase